MNRFDYRQANCDDIVNHYDEFGFVLLKGVPQTILTVIHRKVTEITGLEKTDLEGTHEDRVQRALTPDVRRRLARVAIDSELRNLLFSEFGQLVTHLIGPVVHISESYHVQMKRSAQMDYVLSGYFDDGKEVEAPYGFHQDFTGGRVTTSPSMMIFWFPLCTRSSPALQVYPKSHQLGLFCNTWLAPDNEGLARLGKPIEIYPQEGELLIFNALTLHASRVSPTRRISCDLRFFPFCGFLDSTPHVLTDNPWQFIEARLTHRLGDTIRAPLFEDLAFVGAPLSIPPPADHSVLCWPHYVQARLKGTASDALRYLTNMVNEDLGFEKASMFLEKYEDDHLLMKPYAAILSTLPAPAQKRCRTFLRERGLL